MICSVGQLADQKVSKPTWLSSWIFIKVWQLKRTSQQGEIELPPELAKLKSESDFWRLFRVSCHARWGLSGTRLFSRVTYLHFFVLTLWDYLTQRASHTILFTLFIASCFVSTVWLWAAPVRGSGFCQIPGTRDCGTLINNLQKKRLGTSILRSQSDLQSRYFLCISQFQLRPAPPPPTGYCEAFAHLVSPRGVGHLQILCCPGAGHLPTPETFPSFWHARGFPSEYNYTEDFTGKESRFAHLSRTWINWRGL